MMFTDAFIKYFKDHAKLLAISDINQGRLALAEKSLKPTFGDIPCYKAEDFDKMLKTHRPDCVIVTTIDRAHDEYICRSLEAVCDVITEKPMTIDEKKCQRIIDTVKKTGKKVRVTFNYRYSPPRSQVKELLLSGVIGKILSVTFQWVLDTNHGADYFRRWHRNKSNSGGLMVHKATHHFDLINWWLGTVPETVFARGARVFYNAKQAERYGLAGRATRCRDCKLGHKCNYYLDMSSIDVIKELYLDNEQYDGYLRDKCVFSDEIDIEDTMNLVVTYKSGAFMSYSLVAFSSWEGYRVEFTGTKGRLEHYCQEASYINGDGSIPGELKPEGTSIRIFPQFQTPYTVPIHRGEGGHGGGDIVMLHDIFMPNAQPDPLRRSADYVQGAYSILTGIAANKSMATNAMIYVDQLVKGLPDPNFLPMPGQNESIPYVSDSQHLLDGRKAEGIIPVRLLEENQH
jgi:predicted dehydrogenase